MLRLDRGIEDVVLREEEEAEDEGELPLRLFLPAHFQDLLLIRLLPRMCHSFLSEFLLAVQDRRLPLPQPDPNSFPRLQLPQLPPYRLPLPHQTSRYRAAPDPDPFYHNGARSYIDTRTQTRPNCSSRRSLRATDLRHALRSLNYLLGSLSLYYYLVSAVLILFPSRTHDGKRETTRLFLFLSLSLSSLLFSPFRV